MVQIVQFCGNFHKTNSLPQPAKNGVKKSFVVITTKLSIPEAKKAVKKKP